MKPLSGLVDRLLSRGVMYFLIHLLVPLAFLPFLGPAIIAVALPSTAYLLTSKSSHLYQIGSQYPAVLIPWALLATVRGLSRIEEWPWSSEIMRRWLPAGLLVTGTLGANLVVNPVYVAWRSGYFTDWQRNEAVQVALRQIPSEAGVMTINSLGAEVTNRQVLMAAEQYGLLASQSHLEEVDYVLLDLVDCRLFGGSDPRLTYAQFVRALLESGSFGIDRWEGRILLLRRDESSTREETLTQVQEYVNRLVEEKRPCWP